MEQRALSTGDTVHDAHAGETANAGGSSRRYFNQAPQSVVRSWRSRRSLPFVSYWAPSEKAKALGAPVKIDISKLAPGEMLSPIVAWRGKPVFVVHRDPDTLVERLETDTGMLADPNSEMASSSQTSR